jgi:hypothetical protein
LNSSTEPLSAEAERLLAAVPETIGDGPAEAIDPNAGAQQGTESGDAIAALMQQIAFEPQDVQDQLSEFFEWLAERFKSDHWKLTERQARMLGKPAAQLLNSVWTKLQAILPDILARWCDSTPGATAFLLASGIVVVPKIGKQIAISRARAGANAAAKMVQPGTSHGPAQPAPQPSAQPRTPQPSTAGSMIWQSGA